MRTAMVMVMGKTPLRHRAAPNHCPEAFLYPCCSIFVHVDRLTIDQDRRPRLFVPAAFGEHELFRFSLVFSSAQDVRSLRIGTNCAAVCFLQSC